MGKQTVFPKNFLWGASTASHQVEGGTYNQWTVWELENAKRLASTAKRRLDWLPEWDKIKAQAQDPDNYLSGGGINHYQLYEKDFELIPELNMNSFRFGIEWSRMEPEEGAWNIEAIVHYRNYIESLLERGIEPVLNLWHWTMPVWFTDKGGFEKRANLVYFDRFVEKVCKELPIKKLRFVITLNEPNVYSSFGYGTGEWPPGVKNWFRFLKVYWNLTRAHRRSYKIIKKQCKHVQVGVAAQLANIQAKRPHNILDQLSTKWMRYFWNWWFLNRIGPYQDFVGVNYYFTDYYVTGQYKQRKNIEVFHRENPGMPKNDLGWYMEPEGIYPLMMRVWTHYKKPIIITENGVADQEDKYRRWWIEETIVAMERALSEGVQIRGYFHWSLLDNFEWAYGWWPKFGLVAVDRKTLKRTVRPSAKWFAAKIKELSEQYYNVDKNISK
jgi:beta-glucosidase